MKRHKSAEAVHSMSNTALVFSRKVYVVRRYQKLSSSVEAVPITGISSVQSEDERYMRLALEYAKLGASKGEVPVGAVLVSEDEVLAAAHNTTESTPSPLAHAELLCLQAAVAEMKSWRLSSCTLYVTLEPCPMCAGAILQSRIKRVVYGARQPRIGADGSWISMFPLENLTQEQQQQQQAASSKCRGKVGFATFYNPTRRTRKAKQGRAFVAPPTASRLPPAVTGDIGRNINSLPVASDSSSTVGHDQQPSGVPSRPHAFHPNIEVTRGILHEDCAAVLQDFFRLGPPSTSAKHT
jgi:tRNA(adenine34) deaminase